MDIFNWLKVALAGVLGAAVSGAATGATQQMSTGNMDGKAIGAAATSGAIIGALGYLVKSPRQ